MSTSSLTKSVETPTLQIAYEESGSTKDFPVILLHGFPYGVRQYDAMRDDLVDLKLRVLVPYLRGFGTTQYRDEHTFRSGQQAAIAQDLVDFMDALGVSQAILVGYDWGGRAACIVAALWPERVRGLVSCGGYAVQNITKLATEPTTADIAYRRWYTHYFNTEVGRIGFQQNHNELCQLLWKLWSPDWQFSEAEYQKTAASFENPDFIATVIHSYRHRCANAAGANEYEEIEARLADQSLTIGVPTIVMSGASDGVEPPPATDSQRDRFTGYYERHVLPKVGHCPPAEAPKEVVAAIKTLYEL